MSDDERDLPGLSRLAIFPLPDAVLLPHDEVPLHIFEPRYRAMVKHCLETKALLALAQLKPATRRELDSAQAPRVLPIIGVGHIARSELLPDGRYNITLEGLHRARIAEELVTDTPYRLVRADELGDLDAGSTEASNAADALEGLLLAFCRARPGQGVQALLDQARRAKDASELADRVGAAIIDSPRERQALLEELSVQKRLRKVSHAVAALFAKVMPRPEQLN